MWNAEENVISDNILSGASQVGIVVLGRFNVIRGNSITGNEQCGIRASGRDNLIECNLIRPPVEKPDGWLPVIR